MNQALTLRLAAGIAVLGAAGCVDDGTPAPDAQSAVNDATIAAQTTVAPSPNAWIAFDAEWNPELGELTFELTDAAHQGLRTEAQPLYCERRLTTGRPDTFRLATQAGSIGFTPGDCGLLDEFPYSSTGAFCATIDVTSFFPDRIDGVYAEITSVVPDSGYNGYASPLGTGADPTLLPAGYNLPSDIAGGLWSYGPMQSGETVSVQWVLQYEPGPFRFSGRVLAAVPERINGVDDNCDGAVDEGPYAAGEACTVDADCFHNSCDAGTCVDPDAACPAGFWGPGCANACNCDDGLFCNGEETCDSVLGCQAGTPPSEDDGVSCTVATCNEATDSFDHTPDDALCDNGLFCDGAETCDATLDCQVGTPPTDDDGVSCTVATCNEATDAFDHAPDDALCDNGLFCDGSETCDPTLDCQPGITPTADDGVSCTVDSCDEANDTIVNAPNDALCDNGQFCDGSETCDATLDCQAGTAPSTDDGVSCTVDTCNEATDTIDHAPNNALCDNGLFCDGSETCDATLDCQAGSAPTSDDGVSCTVASCNEATDSIDHTPNDALCDNGLFCDGSETCDATLDCQAGTAPTADDGVACTDDSCDEANDTIVNAPNNALCDNGLFCDGSETCNATLGCQAGTAPTDDDGVSCTVDTCDESIDDFTHTPSDALCDDSLECTADACDIAGGCSNTAVADRTLCTSCVGANCECWNGLCANEGPFSLDLSAELTHDCVLNTGDTTQDGMDAGSYVFVTDAIAGSNLPNDGFVGGSDQHPPVQMNWSDSDDGNNCSIMGGSDSITFAVPPIEQPVSDVYDAVTDGRLGRQPWTFDSGQGLGFGVNEGPGHAIYGPYVTDLREGGWYADFRVKVDVCCTNSDLLVTLDVWDATANQQLGFVNVNRDMFGANDTYQTFTVPFNMVGRAGNAIEARVYHHRRAYMRVESITLREQRPALRIIGTSVDGDVDVQVEVFYEGGGSDVVTHTFIDWFNEPGGGLGYILDGLDRYQIGGSLEDVNDPGIFYSSHFPSGDVNQVTLTRSGGSGTFIFFGASFW